MSLVQGEDSESDEEINTDQLHAFTVSPDGSLSGLSSLTAQTAAKAGIVMGEESETDEEDEGEASLEQTDSGAGIQSGDRLSIPPLTGQSGSASPTGSPRRSSLDSTASSAPQSLLHKKLRESNVSLRRSIVERVLKLYHVTSRNLTIVNDNLSRAQGIVEKVNTQLKRSDNELAKLNSIMEQVSTDAQTFAVNINVEVTTTSPKKSQSPLLHKLRQHKGKVPSLPSFLRNASHDSSTGIDEQVVEARPEGRGGSSPPKPS